MTTLTSFLAWVDTQPSWAVELVVFAFLLACYALIDMAVRRWPNLFKE
jgi:hypothetical protein